MCIKDKKWLKRFCLALLGLCLYLFDNGTDTAVANRLIQNCHVRFGAHVLCLVYVLPGLLISINTMINDKNQNESLNRKWNKYRKIASSNTSRLEAHVGFFRLLMKGPYVLSPFDKKLIF